MAWIKTINYDASDSVLKRIYDRVKGPNNTIDNILKVHSLRPHSLTGHMTLYKHVIHHASNTLPKWYLESIGVYVSYLNHCNYCVSHHFTGLQRLLNNKAKAAKFLKAVKEDHTNAFFDDKFAQGMAYAKKLTLEMGLISESDILALKASGFTDGEILEINQVTGYFNYANRTVLGLGVELGDDILGLSPNNSDDPNQWNHQ